MGLPVPAIVDGDSRYLDDFLAGFQHVKYHSRNVKSSHKSPEEGRRPGKEAFLVASIAAPRSFIEVEIRTGRVAAERGGEKR